MIRGMIRSTPLAALALLLPIGCSQGFNVTADTRPAPEWPAAEAQILTNVIQLTSPAMGLDKSGEAYFAPDGRKIIFQAYPKGQTHYQMFTLDLNADGTPVRESLKQVS